MYYMSDAGLVCIKCRGTQVSFRKKSYKVIDTLYFKRLRYTGNAVGLLAMGLLMMDAFIYDVQSFTTAPSLIAATIAVTLICGESALAAYFEKRYRSCLFATCLQCGFTWKHARSQTRINFF